MIAAVAMALAAQAKTLVVYYSYTNNVARIVGELTSQIEADVIRVEPAEKGLDYAADNYAIGSAQIAAIRNNPDDIASYPAIDPVEVNLDDYDCVMVGAPAVVEQHGRPASDFPLPARQGDGRQENRTHRVERQQRNQRSGGRCQAPYPRRRFLHPESLDSLLSDLQRRLIGSGMAEDYRL